MFRTTVQLLVLRIVLRLYYGTKRKLFYEVYRSYIYVQITCIMYGICFTHVSKNDEMIITTHHAKSLIKVAT